MPSHDSGKPGRGRKQLSGTVRPDHPFGQTACEVRLAILTGRHKTQEGDFIGAQTGATRLMVLNGPPRVAL